MLHINYLRCINYISLFQRRFKSKVHWAKLKKKTSSTDRAMDHFDDFYGSVFGNKWDSIKTALLRRPKYIALVNNYGDPEETESFLASRGAHDMRRLLQVQNNQPESVAINQIDHGNKTDNAIANYVNKAQTDDILGVYPSSDVAPETIMTNEYVLNLNGIDEMSSKHDSIPHQASLATSLDSAVIDESRIIHPDTVNVSGALYQYIPATKLQGRDDWIPESQHYSYFDKGKDFPLTIEKEDKLIIPEHLKIFTFEGENLSKFPEPRRCLTGVYNYYPMDGASILSVLALDIRHGDRVLDLCAAPGGKSLVALQTLLADVVVSNDSSLSRVNRLQRVFKDYLCDYVKSDNWRQRTRVTNVDGRRYFDEHLFDKILVDVPCTTDRHSVKEDENNIFRPDRVKERLKIPELQAELLTHALTQLKPGGTLVYSTCTLSPIQNDGVVHMALKNAFEQHGIKTVIRDLTNAMRYFDSMYQFARNEIAPKYGQLVTPHISSNFGPSYFSKIVRI